MEHTTQTGLRISESLYEKIETIAKECDVSKNSAIKMLIGMGIKAYDSISVTTQQESPH